MTTRYYTGIPCEKGHDVERLISSGECVECKRLRERRKYQENGGQQSKAQYAQNREKRLALQKHNDALRKDEKLKYGKEWRSQNKERTKRYRQDNAGLYAFHTALRRKRVKQATPHWAELDAILLLYEEAARQHKQVDHIVPITNDVVCGLNVIANLQLLTEEENKKKRNKFSS